MLAFVILTTIFNFVIISLTIKLAWKIKFLSYPNSIFVTQKKPVAYLGGTAIFLALLINSVTYHLLFSKTPDNLTNSLALIILCYFMIIGLIDDALVLKPQTKLLFQILGGLLTLYSGFYFTVFSFEPFNFVFSGFILLFLVNAFNLIDVSDGLLISIFITILLFFCLTSNRIALLAMIGVPAVVFLFFNKPEAKIYLGDSGSHLLGILAYVLIVDYNDGFLSLDDLTTLVLVFSIVIFEFIFLIYRRLKKKISIFKGSPDHYSILLRKASWSKQKILSLSYIINLSFVIIAFYSRIYSFEWKLFLVIITAIIYCFFGYYINKLKYEKGYE